MRIAYCLLLIVILPSCFLFKDYKRRTFTYTNAEGQSADVPIIVPKGFKREERVKDSLGHEGVLYHYSNDARFYIVHYPDSGSYVAIDTSMHIPQLHKQGGIFYKGIDSTKRWWREAQPPSFRIGYLNINRAHEVLFDSAVNYLNPATLESKRL
jgi:hypothetical protein